jgi:hypothetical protein
LALPLLTVLLYRLNKRPTHDGGSGGDVLDTQWLGNNCSLILFFIICRNIQQKSYLLFQIFMFRFCAFTGFCHTVPSCKYPYAPINETGGERLHPTGLPNVSEIMDSKDEN